MVQYKNTLLAKNSEALAMWEAWQAAKKDRNQLQKKLDDHLKQLDKNEADLIKRYEHLEKRK